MASATSTTKHRDSLNGNGIKKKTAKKAVLSASTATSGTSMQSSTTSVKLAPQNASVSEKRRVAALISWEKRRAKLSNHIAAKAKSAATKSKRKRTTAATSTVTTAIARPVSPVTPPKDKKRVSVPSAKKRKIEAAGAICNKSTSSKENKAEDGQEQENNVAVSRKLYDRSQAAKMGWERKRNKKNASEIRRKAAKLGWERKRNKRLAESGGSDAGSPIASNASSLVDEPSPAALPAPEKKKAAPPTISKGGYSAAARRKAAKLGWEKRRNEKAARSVSTSEGTTSSAASKAPSQAAASTKRDTKPHRQGSKRSRRLASFEESSNGTDGTTDAAVPHETEGRKMNELVTYLRLSRGWMEFHPSSRHGSGTATYGYIPSSIATFIRSGAISQRTVLDHGTLGVHYALDWDGYGGLKEMIDTFGEDFSPYPTDEMMENVQVPVPEWELGDDLPWREMEEAEKLLALKGENSNSVAKIEGDDMEKILFVAGILASLDRSAVADTSDSDKCKQDHGLRNTTADMVSSNTSSPSILAPKNHDSSGGYNSDTNKCPLSHLADVTVKNECTDENKSNILQEGNLVNHTPCRNFNHWNFGL